MAGRCPAGASLPPPWPPPSSSPPASRRRGRRARAGALDLGGVPGAGDALRRGRRRGSRCAAAEKVTRSNFVLKVTLTLSVPRSASRTVKVRGGAIDRGDATLDMAGHGGARRGGARREVAVAPAPVAAIPPAARAAVAAAMVGVVLMVLPPGDPIGGFQRTGRRSRAGPQARPRERFGVGKATRSYDGWFRGRRARVCAGRGCPARGPKGNSAGCPGPFGPWRSGAAERVQAGAGVVESAI